MIDLGRLVWLAGVAFTQGWRGVIDLGWLVWLVGGDGLLLRKLDGMGLAHLVSTGVRAHGTNVREGCILSEHWVFMLGHGHDGVDTG